MEVVLKPLPFADPDRLVQLGALTPKGDAFSVSEVAILRSWTSSPPDHQSETARQGEP